MVRQLACSGQISRLTSDLMLEIMEESLLLGELDSSGLRIRSHLVRLKKMLSKKVEWKQIVEEKANKRS